MAIIRQHYSTNPTILYGSIILEETEEKLGYSKPMI